MPQQLNLDMEPVVNPAPLASPAPPSPAPVRSTSLDTAVHAYRFGDLSAQALRLHQVLTFSRQLLPGHDHSRGLSYAALGMFMEQRPSTASPDAKVRGAGKKNVVIRAAQELEDRGLVRRRRSANQQGQTLGPGTPYLWHLVTDEEAPAPRWSEAPEAIRVHIGRHQRDLSITEGAIFSVLAYMADEDGCLALSSSQLTEGTGFSSKRVLQALTALEDHKAGIHARSLEYAPGVRSATHNIALAVPGLGLVSTPATEQPSASSNGEARTAAPPATPGKRKPRVTTAEAEELWSQVKHKELVKQAVTVLSGTLEEGKKPTPTKLVNSVLRPVIELQEQYPSPCVEYGLQETLKRLQPDHRFASGFGKYLARVCENNRYRFDRNVNIKAPVAGTNAAAAHAVSPEGIAELCEQRLAEAAELNRQGNGEQARVILNRLLAGTRHLAVLFDDDEAKAERHLREAFKRGIEDFRYAYDYTIATDYLPEWSDS